MYSRKYKIILKKEEEKYILEYIKGNLTCRELGEKINLSHQGAINLVSKIVQQWYQDGKIKI